MQLSDQKVIDFLSKSPLKSFSAMRDTLRYLEGSWIWEDVEYQLFDEGLGDNPKRKVSIRVPHVPGIAANALFAFTWHAKSFNLVRRRPRKLPSSPRGLQDELIVFYELTPAGKEMVRVLEAIERVRPAK